ncbi:MAG: sensor histidine kinase [Cyclobacteriaceae bacterium]|jgi:two-component system LytT family sensor kinase|nr:histidine kinase [Flammeovirgaceae bacterium]
MSNNSKSTRFKRGVIILSVAAIFWAAQFWFFTQWLQFAFELAAYDALITTNWILLSCGLLELILTRYTPKVGKYQFVLALSVAVCALCYWILDQSLLMLGENNTDYLSFLQKVAPVRIGMIFLILAAWSIGQLLFKQLNELQESIEQQSSTESMVREAELQKLQLQLQPHFLFNSLNSINALILVNASKAREMVQQLSDFLRTTLRRADEHWITLEQELAYLQLYLSIEKVRFGHRLEVKMECDEQIKLWLIPPLLIQPLVENAIKFGLYGTTEAVVISMSTTRINDSLQIVITNPFDKDMQPAEGSGFGLNGLKRRLYLLYTRNDLLQTAIHDNHFTVTLTLPERV